MITTKKSTDHVIIEITGQVTIRELLEYAQTHVDEWFNQPVIWDLTEGRIDSSESDYPTVRAIVSNINELVEKRKGKGTVFVAPDPLSYGMLRMAIMIVEATEFHFIAFVCRSMEEAEEWLRGYSN